MGLLGTKTQDGRHRKLASECPLGPLKMGPHLSHVTPSTQHGVGRAVGRAS